LSLKEPLRALARKRSWAAFGPHTEGKCLFAGNFSRPRPRGPIPSHGGDDRRCDPDGRSVELTDEGWAHIVGGHPELAPHRDDVIRAVQVPDHRRDGRRAREEWFYSEGVGPSRFLKVVVAYDDFEGRIITVFARRSLP